MEQLPRFMNIKQFCRHTGLSRWRLQRAIDRYQIPLTDAGVSKMLEVEPTIQILARIPGIQHLVDSDLIRKLREAVQPEAAE